ncbi:MAG: indole-3-glycerol phosphate synthase TrpC [Prevotella sp.]|nr:indole-3-glycerol phosphate synthase TrpC [Prevotella sp.]
MANILEEIIAWKQREVELMKGLTPERNLRRIINEQTFYKRPPIADALKESTTGIIAEFKRKSPSHGWFSQDAKASDIPYSYQQNGAAAISILTDNRYFDGSDEFMKEARMSGVRIPMLYKNFVIDEYQLLQARLAGAATVLLIAACMPISRCKELLEAAHGLGLEVLLEMHNEDELDYAELQPDLYGINNRDLRTMTTNVETSFRLGELLPADAVKVSESGISDPHIVRELREAGFSGFLIGEHFMKTKDPGQALADFIAKL